MSASDRLKIIRETLGKTQKEMSALTGISYRTWQNYEDGVNNPGWDACEALVKLNFNANWIFTGEGEMWHKSPGTIEIGDSKDVILSTGDVTDNQDFSLAIDIMKAVEGSGKFKIYKTSGHHDKAVVEIVDILEHDLPEAKPFILKILRGKKELKEGLGGLGMKLKEES